MRFEKEFPNLKLGETLEGIQKRLKSKLDHASTIELHGLYEEFKKKKWHLESTILRHCIEKRKVGAAIEKVINHGNDRELLIRNYLFKELGLE